MLLTGRYGDLMACAVLSRQLLLSVVVVLVRHDVRYNVPDSSTPISAMLSLLPSMRVVPTPRLEAMRPNALHQKCACLPLRLLVSSLPCLHFVDGARSLGSGGVLRFCVVNVDDRFARNSSNSLPPLLELFLGAHEEAQ